MYLHTHRFRYRYLKNEFSIKPILATIKQYAILRMTSFEKSLFIRSHDWFKRLYFISILIIVRDKTVSDRLS